MPKNISEKDLYPIEALLAGRPDGWRVEEIEKALENHGLSLNRRTLQRRLAQLEKAGRIKVAGRGRATRYHPVVSAEKSSEAEGGILLSIEAKEVINQISRPLSAKGYRGWRRIFRLSATNCARCPSWMYLKTFI